MDSSKELLLNYSQQMKSEGFAILFSIRRILGFVILLISPLPHLPLLKLFVFLVSIYYLLSSYLMLRSHKLKNSNFKLHTKVILFSDLILLMLTFYSSIILHGQGLAAVPMANNAFYTMFFFLLLYSGFALDLNLTIAIAVGCTLFYSLAILLTMQYGAELYLGSETFTPGPNRISFRLELIRILFLILISICYVKLVKFLYGLLEKNHKRLIEEIELRESKLVSQARLVTLGSLVSNLSHEINNPLAGIRGAVELLQEENSLFLNELNKDFKTSFSDWDRELELSVDARKDTRKISKEFAKLDFGLDPSQKDYLIEKTLDLNIKIPSFFTENGDALEKKQSYLFWLRNRYNQKVVSLIINSIERTERILSSLRYFSKPNDVADLQEIDISASLDSAIQVYSKFWAENRNFRKEIIQKFKIYANENSIKLVWSHLIYNSIQATLNKTGEIHYKIYRDGREGLVEITDNGVGITESDIANIFNPFFSTKVEGEGTGLGLFLSKEILNEMGCQIECSSQPGKTTFKLTFTNLVSD